MKKCSEVMTNNPVCCLPEDKVVDVAQLMKVRNIGSVPVVEKDRSRKLVGIVTDRDLALQIVAEGRDPKTTKVESIMSRKVVTCRADDDLQKAMDAMSKHQLRRIPIVDNEKQLVGIIAQADVATRVSEPENTAAMVKGISKPNGK